MENRPINKQDRYMKKFGEDRAPVLLKMMSERGKECNINLQVAVINNHYLSMC